MQVSLSSSCRPSASNRLNRLRHLHGVFMGFNLFKPYPKQFLPHRLSQILSTHLSLHLTLILLFHSTTFVRRIPLSFVTDPDLLPYTNRSFRSIITIYPYIPSHSSARTLSACCATTYHLPFGPLHPPLLHPRPSNSYSRARCLSILPLAGLSAASSEYTIYTTPAHP